MVNLDNDDFGLDESLDEQYEKTEARDMGRLPDGKYEGEIVEVSLKRTKNGRVSFSWQLSVLNPVEYLGRMAFVSNFFDDELQLGILKHNLRIVGKENVKPSQLKDPNVRIGFSGIILAFTIKTTIGKKDGKEYTNIYFNRMVRNKFDGATGSSSVKVATKKEAKQAEPVQAELIDDDDNDDGEGLPF